VQPSVQQPAVLRLEAAAWMWPSAQQPAEGAVLL